MHARARMPGGRGRAREALPLPSHSRHSRAVAKIRNRTDGVKETNGLEVFAGAVVDGKAVQD